MFVKLIKRPLLDVAVVGSGSRRWLHIAQRMAGAHFDHMVPARQPFQGRHIGPSQTEQQKMLKAVECKVRYLMLRNDTCFVFVCSHLLAKRIRFWFPFQCLQVPEYRR